MAKQHNRDDIEDRTFAYKNERRKASFKGYVQDIDHLEYAIVSNEIIPVAILELTRRDPLPNLPNPPESYFKSILKRYETDAQGKFSKSIAKMLGIEAYITVFGNDMKRIWVYNLSKQIGWKRFSKKDYFSWLERKHNEAIENYQKGKQ